MTDNITETRDLLTSPELQVLSSLSPEQVDQIQRFRASVSDMEGRVRTPEEEEQRAEKFCSDEDARRWILAYEKKDLVGMTVLFGRQIPYRDGAVSLGGVGKVRVREDMRRKGVAKAMIGEAMRQLVDMKSDVAFLDTDIDSFLANFYREYGFVPLNRPYTYTGKSGARYRDSDGMLAPVISPKVFQAMVTGSEPLDIGRGKW